MKKLQPILIILFMASCSLVKAQGVFANVTPPAFHYAELEKFSFEKNNLRNALDSISYPKELFNDALLYTLVKPKYLTEAQVKILKNHVKYPANSSDQTREELNFLLKLQNSRTPEQISEVLELNKVGYWPEIDVLDSHPQYDENQKHLFYILNEAMGENYNAANSPHTALLLKKIMNDMRLMEFMVKYHHLRARPYQLDRRLEPLRKISSPSFASGHTLWAYLQSFVLSEIIPGKREVLLNLAYEVGVSREIMGVHFPSDEEAARLLAHEMIRLMWMSEEFKIDLQNAQREWERRCVISLWESSS